MPTTPFAPEHDALRRSVGRLVDGPLAGLAQRAEAAERVQAEAVAACLPLGVAELADVLADVVVAEELGRLRSAGLAAVVLNTIAAADAGLDVTGGLVAVATEGTVVIDGGGAASGFLPMVVGGAVAQRCLVLAGGVVTEQGNGWTAHVADSPHALRGAAPADLRLDGAVAAAVEICAAVRQRHLLREAAAAVSGAWQTWRDAREYAGQRTAFGRPIGRFQVNRHALAEAATWLTAAESLVHDTAWALSTGAHPPAAFARQYAGTVAAAVADLCLQLHGGFGYTTAFDVERAWRDAHALHRGDDDRRRLIAAAHPLEGVLS